jgi:uncharacterized protein
MLRLLLILIAVVVLLRLLGWRPPGRRIADPPRVPPPAERASHDDLVQCARCAVHLPRSLALARGERWYCSPEHRDTA